MKRNTFALLLGLGLAHQVNLPTVGPSQDSFRLIEQLKRILRTTQSIVNKQAVVYYLLYFYPSLTQLVGSCMLDTENLQALEDVLCVACTPGMF